MLVPEDIAAIWLSLQVALTATALALPFGFALAWLIVFKQFRGKVVLEVLINLPLTLPPVVIGFFLLLLLGKNGWIGKVLDASGIPIIFYLESRRDCIGNSGFSAVGAFNPTWYGVHRPAAYCSLPKSWCSMVRYPCNHYSSALPAGNNGRFVAYVCPEPW